MLRSMANCSEAHLCNKLGGTEDEHKREKDQREGTVDIAELFDTSVQTSVD